MEITNHPIYDTTKNLRRFFRKVVLFRAGLNMGDFIYGKIFRGGGE